MKFRFSQSLRLWIMVLFILAGVIPCILIKEVILENYEKQAVSLRTADIQNQCAILCNQLGSSNDAQGVMSESILMELTQLSNIYNGRVMVIDRDYHIVEDTYDIDQNKTIVSGDVIRCFQGKGTANYDDVNRYIEVTSPITDGNSKKVQGVMLVSVSTDIIADNIALFSNRANFVIGLSAVLIICIAVLAGTWMTRPFYRIIKSIGAVTDGYEEESLKVYTYKETRLISDAFNKMLGRLKALDESRKEFVSNVSHELKTPLTSMKVLADALISQPGAPVELYQEFMGDLSEEIERESKIIDDLLSLVKMDQSQKSANTMNIESENINHLVEAILKRLKPIAKKEQVEIIFESIRPVQAEVDKVKLSLAITNLVENAVKYNKASGWVHVTLNADHKAFYIEVADSGMGIPEEDIAHIFERFYRVDKSHSREIGGTGLGLSIARSAVVMHRGSIKVFSQVGNGTTFTIRIPLKYVVV